MPPPGGGGKRGVWCSKAHPLIEAELFAAERCRPAPSGRALLCAAVYAKQIQGNEASQNLPDARNRALVTPVSPRDRRESRRKGGFGGVKRGQGNHTVPLPPFVSAARRRQCTRHAMANIPQPGRAYLAFSGTPLYRRKILRLLSVKQKGHSSPAAASRRNGGTASPLLTVSQAKREPFGSL